MLRSARHLRHSGTPDAIGGWPLIRGGCGMATKSAILLSSPAKRRRLREIIKAQSLLKDHDYVLASGRKSGYYFNMKKTTFDPEGCSLIAEMVYDEVAEENGIYIGGLANGATPIVSTTVLVSAAHNPKMGFYVRDEIKNHGTQQLIEGFIEDGADVILVDDVTTSGGSVMKAVAAVRARKCKVKKVITIVDRLEGATETFRREGIEFVAFFTTRDFD
jgi:orotate phosphoribosyltransferase